MLFLLIFMNGTQVAKHTVVTRMSFGPNRCVHNCEAEGQALLNRTISKSVEDGEIRTLRASKHNS